MARPSSAMLALNCLFSMLISLPQPSQVRREWLRKYPIGLDWPVPQALQITSMVTLSSEFFGMCGCIPVIRRAGS
jgi:hypothetical protein